MLEMANISFAITSTDSSMAGMKMDHISDWDGMSTLGRMYWSRICVAIVIVPEKFQLVTPQKN